ncbi:hypothetical protein PITCH_A1750001 [uncultured Desulfobacterium sp.]|uniref:Uncharacterized protein n=1 Tax=uncultured Desulfobacterium sp. TaxID=201089 RepID=A0A445MUX1_9BACT|nr:hypothetical protein PITCH_A1750001 [uncultured Desulfobacterium sp.]
MKYIREVNRPECRSYNAKDPNNGVRVIVECFRKGATIEDIVPKLILQRGQTWSDNPEKAKEYIRRMIGDFKTSYWYGWLLTKDGDKYFLRHATPAEKCHDKLGDLSKLGKFQKKHYEDKWFKGLCDGIKKGKAADK